MQNIACLLYISHAESRFLVQTVLPSLFLRNEFITKGSAASLKRIHFAMFLLALHFGSRLR